MAKERKISTFVCVCEPDKMGFPIRQAVESYLSFSDEVVVVYGRSEEKSIEPLKELDDRVKIVETHSWPVDWHYDHMRDHLQAGLDCSSGNFILKADADRIFHNEAGTQIRERILKTKSHILNFNSYSFYHPRGFSTYPADTVYCLNTDRLKAEKINFLISNETGSNLPTCDQEIEKEREASFHLCPVNYDDTFLTLEQGLRKWYYWQCAVDKKNKVKKRYGEANEIDINFMTNQYIAYKRVKAACCSLSPDQQHPRCIIDKFGLKDGILNLPDKFKKF